MKSVAPSRRASARNPSTSSRGSAERIVRPAEALHRRARPIGGQLQHLRRARQALTPVRELPLEHLAPQPAALPARKVPILDGQRRQRRRLAPRKKPR